MPPGKGTTAADLPLISRLRAAASPPRGSQRIYPKGRYTPCHLHKKSTQRWSAIRCCLPSQTSAPNCSASLSGRILATRSIRPMLWVCQACCSRPQTCSFRWSVWAWPTRSSGSALIRKTTRPASLSTVRPPLGLAFWCCCSPCRWSA